ncbi:hypothetical protein JQ604_03740 [Bradyrhizobium jicamae]|uniref:hypothetical protein n=1 Tax=Bradyrhizobium jicamae TaxID=280332 RepID=UPI001BA6D299|nr:hypothetical protein [Bradyrhizobium jicamae]MBR0751285.1 hypothetical protein [Bradyrhizobium jicamae]
MSVAVQICRSCRTQFFPPRLRCACCQACAFDEALVRTAVIEDITTIRTRRPDDASRGYLALVVTERNLRLLARLDRCCSPGAQVRLQVAADGAIAAFAEGGADPCGGDDGGSPA